MAILPYPFSACSAAPTTHARRASHTTIKKMRRHKHTPDAVVPPCRLAAPSRQSRVRTPRRDQVAATSALPPSAHSTHCVASPPPPSPPGPPARREPALQPTRPAVACLQMRMRSCHMTGVVLCPHEGSVIRGRSAPEVLSRMQCTSYAPPLRSLWLHLWYSEVQPQEERGVGSQAACEEWSRDGE